MNPSGGGRFAGGGGRVTPSRNQPMTQGAFPILVHRNVKLQNLCLNNRNPTLFRGADPKGAHRQSQYMAAFSIGPHSHNANGHVQVVTSVCQMPDTYLGFSLSEFETNLRDSGLDEAMVSELSADLLNSFSQFQGVVQIEEDTDNMKIEQALFRGGPMEQPTLLYPLYPGQTVGYGLLAPSQYRQFKSYTLNQHKFPKEFYGMVLKPMTSGDFMTWILEHVSVYLTNPMAIHRAYASNKNPSLLSVLFFCEQLRQFIASTAVTTLEQLMEARLVVPAGVVVVAGEAGAPDETKLERGRTADVGPEGGTSGVGRADHPTLQNHSSGKSLRAFVCDPAGGSVFNPDGSWATRGVTDVVSTTQPSVFCAILRRVLHLIPDPTALDGTNPLIRHACSIAKNPDDVAYWEALQTQIARATMQTENSLLLTPYESGAAVSATTGRITNTGYITANGVAQANTARLTGLSIRNQNLALTQLMAAFYNLSETYQRRCVGTVIHGGAAGDTATVLFRA